MGSMRWGLLTIPTQEEAGYEDANAKVQEGKKVLELPKNY